MSVIVLPVMTMSAGPRAGVPLPSTMVALRMTSRAGRWPCVTPLVWAARLFGEAAAAAIAAAVQRSREKTIERLRFIRGVAGAETLFQRRAGRYLQKTDDGRRKMEDGRSRTT